MGKLGGFLEIHRAGIPYRDAKERIHDYQEFVELRSDEEVAEQGARCMECGVPFCHNGCPLGNLIPDWNDLVYRQSWQRWMIGPTAITNLSDFTCADGAMRIPADPAPDEEWPARCTGTNEAVEGEAISEGTYRFSGEKMVKVGDATVTAHGFVSERTMSGAQVGTERSEVWFVAASGLPVSNERTVEARTDTPIGESTYTETGEFHLVSVDPD